MNIFVLSWCPDEAARFLIDAHVGSSSSGGKMIVETAQMLANCYSKERLADAPKTQRGAVRSHSYYNHPSSVWVRQSMSNFMWLVRHGLAMVEEKQYRGGSRHFSADFIEWCLHNTPDNINPEIGLTTPAFAFKKYDHIKDHNDPVASYRKYYVLDKKTDKRGRDMVKYTNRPLPQFWS